MDHILRSKLFSHYHRQCAKEEPILLPPRIEQFYTPIEPEPPLRGSEKPVNETAGQDAEGSLRGRSTTHHHRCCGDYYCYGSGSGRTERGLRGAASTVDPLSDSASDYNGLVAQMQTATRVNAMHDATTTDGSDDDDVINNLHEGRESVVYDAPYMRSRAVGSGVAMSAWRVVDDPLAFPRDDSLNASAPPNTSMNDGNNNNGSSSTVTTTMALPQTLRCDEGSLAANTSNTAHQGITTTTMSHNNVSGSAGEVNGLTTTTTATEEDEGRRRATAASGNDGNVTGQCTITRQVVRRRPTRPQGELLSLCDQTPEARAALRRRRKEQLRAQLNHPEAPVIVQLAERDKRLCTVGTTLTDYVNSVVDLRTQRVQKGLTDLTQVGSVVYAALPTPYSPSESHNNNNTTTTTTTSTSKPGGGEGEKKKTHKAGGKGKGAAVAAAEQHVRYNGLYAKYPGSRKGKKADKQQQQMLLLSRQLPLYDAASPVTFEELREHPLLLTQPRRQARWAGVVHGRVPSEEMYGQPVPYINSDDPSQVNNTTNNNSSNMMTASQQTQQQSYYGYQEYGYYYYHGAQMDKARRASTSLIVQQGQAMGNSCGFQGNAAPSLPSFYTMSEVGMSLTRQNTSSTNTTITTNTAAMMMMMMSSGTNNNTSSSNINVMPSQGMTLVPNTGKLPYTTTTTDYNTSNSSSSMPMYVGTVCTAQPETIGRPIATLAQPPVQTANNNNNTTTTSSNSNDGCQPVMSQGSNPACPCTWSGLTLSNPSPSTPSPPYQLQQQQQQRVEGMTTMGYTVWPPQYNDTNPSPAQRPSFTPEGYAVYLSA